MASEASERGQASVGAASGKDGHGVKETSAGQRRTEEGDENPQRARPAQDPNGGETEERDPPEQSRELNANGRRGGEGEGGPPTQQCAPTACSGGMGGPLNKAAQDPPARRVTGNRNQRGTPSARPHCRTPTKEGRRRGTPPNCRACLTQAAAEGGEGGGGPPTQQRTPMARS